MPYSSRLWSVLRRSVRGQQIEPPLLAHQTQSSSGLAFQPPRFTRETNLESENDLAETMRLVNCGAPRLRQCSFRHFTLRILPPLCGGYSDVFSFLSPYGDGSYCAPMPVSSVIRFTVFPRVRSKLQMLVCESQQRVSPLSFHL